MNKNKKTLNKEIEKGKKIKNLGKHKEAPEEEGGEVLPEDVQEALGIKKQPKAKIKEVDYVAELENGLDDFGLEDSSPKNNFDDEFDSDLS